MYTPALYVLSSVLPCDVVKIIDSFVRLPPKKKKINLSPKAFNDLKRIQRMQLSGKFETYLKDLEDFLLDGF
jgi:hypothetical protein